MAQTSKDSSDKRKIILPYQEMFVLAFSKSKQVHTS